MIEPAKPSPLPATVEITLPKLGTVPAVILLLLLGIVSAAVNDSDNDHVLAQFAGVSPQPFIE